MNTLHIAGLRTGYTDLPEACRTPSAPTAVRAPALIALNESLAAELNLDLAAHPLSAWAEFFAGNRLATEVTPLALAYAGHQFGHFSPQLGDGRAILLGEVTDRHGQRRDVQLKGAGRTPYSRGGDGRAALGPVLREYLVSEAMHALGIPTTRSLAAVTTGDPVIREGVKPGAIVTRVAQSHIRVGTFEYFAAREDQTTLGRLLAAMIDRHYPALAGHPTPALALLEAVAERQSRLVAQWLGVGFVHGVMNTDNMTISGETIDFGPCAFMDHYDPTMVLSAIDRGGRYAYDQQSRIVAWNLARLAEALLPLIDASTERAVTRAMAILSTCEARAAADWLQVFGAKFGLADPTASDRALMETFLDLLAAHQVDFTQAFRALSALAPLEANTDPLCGLFKAPAAPQLWLTQWRHRLAQTGVPQEEITRRMRQSNPWVIPRNHRIEAAIVAAEQGDFGAFERLHQALRHPYEERSEYRDYTHAPAEYERVLATFCGT